MISVVLIEDNRLVREGMTAMLNQTTDFRVVAAGTPVGCSGPYVTPAVAMR